MIRKSFLLLLLIALPAFAQNEDQELLQNVRVQVLLDQAGFSPGEIDGRVGSNTEKALIVFQAANRLAQTGEADDRTLALLSSAGHKVMTLYRITADDVRGPFVRIPHDFMLKAKLPRLSYTSALEGLSEKFHINPDVFELLNPDALLEEGEVVLVPNILIDHATISPAPLIRPAKATVGKTDPPMTIIISGTNNDLMVTRQGQVIFYAPISHGGERDPLPQGKAKIYGVIANPVYRYNPDLFWDANPAHTQAIIRPGPNNPVGAVWIGLNLPHYGLHGTPEPASIGYGESHGCIRLTNWDALRLATLVKPGTEVLFQ